ncbi:beta-glucosidase [Ignisphaera sp. 4213-co]|uniref:Beta-glucosidase n=1 Tax=Ignisphaera cupida TaxID=3050454 RepID=A0ABD4Z6X2_9CREN|nr:glycoside hydrolase family 3 protein [Ignisphaera sp. 4213-co]MDK6028353.1 beta-glucosidase [Ignisphaera sp. 4213-co]
MDVKELLNKLSIEERISLLVGAGFSKIVPGAAGESRAVERLGIPSIVMSDGPAGVRIHPLRFGVKETFYATAFPNEILLSSTWNLDVVERVGKAIGEEAKEYGVDIMLSPGLNMHRIPLCGRNFEYFSEDPLLAGEMAAAYVRGVQSVGVGATLKHFVANDQETGRMYIDVVAPERALREIYLRAFEIAVEKSRPWAIMAAYNKLNGKYCTQNEWLLTKVLRDDWGFDGLVMTDWGAGDNPIEQIKAGVDIIMPGNDNIVKTLIEAYRKGELSEEIINKRVLKVLELVTKSLKFKGYKHSNKPNLDEHAKVAYEAAIEGFVLLKNNDVLPLPQDSKVAVFGKGSYLTARGGLGSGFTHPRYTISIVDGLKERGVKVDEKLEKMYRGLMLPFFELGEITSLFRRFRESALQSGDQGAIQWLLSDYVETMIEYFKIMNIQENIFDDTTLDEIARRNDVALITISRVSGEGFDRYPVKGDFYLRDDEYDLIQRVSKAFHKYGKKVIVLLNVPSPIEIASWRDLVDAIMVIWMPGQEAGRAVADVLLGKVSPSGKLPLTWPKDLYETPAMRSFPGEPRDDPKKVVYEEGIYVGYRYYDTFSVEPAYEFGYGLSYTKFDYKDLDVKVYDNTLVVSLKIRNVGKYVGKEVVQVYVRAPRGRIEKPFQELKGFYKTRALNPDEEENVKINIPLKYLASFDGSKWVVEKGVYEIRVGSSSRDIRLVKTVEIDKDYCYNTSWKQIQCS